MKKYASDYMQISSLADSIFRTGGVFVKYAKQIIDDENEESVIKLFGTISECLSNCDKREKETLVALREKFYLCYGQIISSEIINGEDDTENNTSFDELKKELDGLVGLKRVKESVEGLIVYQQVNKMRNDYDLHSEKTTMHLAFTGNPGTGKTTVARIIGRMYKQLGLLSKGHFIEASRTDLIAGYQGQTAHKVKNLIKRAKGGVLFIDEAYSITENDHSDSYGRECLTELTKALEDYREDLVVIVAGYTEPMDKFFSSNPGLRSRFNTIISFEDFSSDELLEIMKCICRKNDYCLSQELELRLSDYFRQVVSKKESDFSNGRFVRNLFNDLVIEHAKRVISVSEINKKTLCELVVRDFNSIIGKNDGAHWIE